MSEQLDIILRLLAALGAGALIGMERSYQGRPAGFRTHALVCLGSTLLMTLAVFAWLHDPSLTPGDLAAGPQRTLQGVMTGVGFLGAGVIFKEGLNIHGLTTAASLWVTAALGLLIGAGFWIGAGAGLLAILFALSVMRWAEDRMPRKIFVYLTLKFAPATAPGAVSIRAMLLGLGFRSERVRQALNETNGLMEYRLVTSTLNLKGVDNLAALLTSMPEVKGFDLSPTDE